MTKTKNTKLLNRIRHLCYISLVEAIVSAVMMITFGCILTFSAVEGKIPIIWFMIIMFGVAIAIIAILWIIAVHMSNQMIKLYEKSKHQSTPAPQPSVPPPIRPAFPEPVKYPRRRVLPSRSPSTVATKVNPEASKPILKKRPSNLRP